MASVDLYCERTSASLAAEPLNALTNLAFFVAAWWIWREARERDVLGTGIKLLLLLLLSFGTGSLLFHTFANTVTRWLDVLPIALFVVTYLWVYATGIAGLTFSQTSALAALFLVAAYVGRQSPWLLNGSLIYAPTIILLLVISSYHWSTGRPRANLLLASTAVFIMALVFRTIDNMICASWPIGTHFLWHVLTAVALTLATMTLLASIHKSKARLVMR